MPLENDIVRSLRSLTVEAVSELIVAQGQEKLRQIYKLGIFPVRVIDDIYTYLADKTLVEVKRVLSDKLGLYGMADTAYQIAAQERWNIIARTRDQFCESKAKIRAIADAEDKMDEAALAREEAIESLGRMRKTQQDKLEAVRNIFTEEDRLDIKAAVPDSEIEEIYDELAGSELPAIDVDGSVLL